MSKGKKHKSSMRKHKPPTGKQQAAKQGHSIWVWMLIGAAAGLAVWLALRFIAPLFGG